jgi:CubicO group peptidase (beta-lactamase class C family)
MTPEFKAVMRILCSLVTLLWVQGQIRADVVDFDVGLESLVGPMIEERLIPGFYLGVYDKNGLIFEKAGGFADEKLELLPGRDVLYHVNSMSKPLTGLLLVRLEELGLLDLDDPIAKYLPKFEERRGIQDLISQGGSALKTSAITIRQALTHTSGFTRSGTKSSSRELADAYRKHGLLTLGGTVRSRLGDLANHVNKLAELPLNSPPNSRFEYSVGFDVAARVAEVVTNKALPEAMREFVLDPLGMEDSHFSVPPEKLERLARLYGPRGRTYQLPGKPRRYRAYAGLPKEHKNFGIADTGYFSGSTGLLTTAEDYARFMQLILNNGKIDGRKWLSPTGVSYLSENQLPVHLNQNDMTDSLPELVNSGYSLGMAVKLLPGGSLSDKSTYKYLYWASESNTQFWIDPKLGLAAIFLTQHLPEKYFVAEKIHELAGEHLVD